MIVSLFRFILTSLGLPNDKLNEKTITKLNLFILYEAAIVLVAALIQSLFGILVIILFVIIGISLMFDIGFYMSAVNNYVITSSSELASLSYDLRRANKNIKNNEDELKEYQEAYEKEINSLYKDSNEQREKYEKEIASLYEDLNKQHEKYEKEIASLYEELARQTNEH